MAAKVTTGLVGLGVVPKPREKLLIIYNNLLKVVSAMPQTAAYRKYTEEFAKQRLGTLESTTDLTVLEKTLNSGQLEEVIQQAKSELRLARKMAKWQPWNSVAAEPPVGQWDWP